MISQHPAGTRPLGWPAWLAFCAGCLLLPVLPALPPGGWLMALGAAGLLLPARRIDLVIFSAFLLGLGWVSFHAQSGLDDAWPQARAGEEIRVTGTVTGMVESRDRRLRFELRPKAGQDPDLPRRIRVDWHWFDGMPAAGEQWQFTLRMAPPAGRLNPAGFDARRWMLAARIGASGTVAGSGQRIAPVSRHGVAATRMALAEWVQATTHSLEAAAVQRALAVADRSAMPAELTDTLRRTGTAHLLAISGLHVGMVFGAVALVLRWLLAPLTAVFIRAGPGRMALVGGLLAALAYAVLAGFTLPTRRALVMLSVVVVAMVFRRGLRPGHGLLLALVAVLLVDPLAPLATGFWLSFAAVGVLIWGFAWRPGAQGAFAGLFRAQLLVAVGLAALNVAVFGQFVPGAFAANLVAIPLVALWVLPALLLAVVLALGGLYGLAAWPLAFSEQGLILVLGWIETLSRLPGGWWPMPTVSGPLVAVAFLGGVWLIAPRGVPGRALAPFLMLPLVLSTGSTSPGQGFDVHVLDVGHGQSVLVRAGPETWLVGTGPGDGAGLDVVAGTLKPVIRRYGRGRVDLAVASPEGRVYAGGLASVESLYAPGRILAWPGREGAEACREGLVHQAGQVRLEVLHPAPALPDLGHNSGCVIRISGPGGSLVIPGPVDEAVETRLARHGPDPAAKVLLAARQGHEASTTADFLDAVDPQKVVASAGAGNRFELPHAALEARLEARGIGFAGTHECGAVTIGFRPGLEPRMETARGQSRRFWHANPLARCP